MSDLIRAVSIEDLRRRARRRLPRAVFDFIDGGSGDEVTLASNQEGFGDWILLPRVGMDVSKRSAATTILDRPASLPLVLAPTGLAGLFWPGGEIEASRAAGEAGIPFCLSTNSVASIEEVAEATPQTDRWFQLYMLRDRGLMRELLERARRSGYGTLCVTLDLPVQGRRERDLRNAFAVPFRPGLSTLFDLARRPRFLLGLSRAPVRFGNFGSLGAGGAVPVAQHVATLFDPTADWDDIASLRQSWSGRFVIKGLLHPDDARRAVAIGAEAIIVSNHGGRQLDGAPAAIRALPDIADAIGDGAEIILDGGIRRGVDILKALALGASACMIGRAFLWGLAAGGQAGVSRAIGILADEIDNAMALLGVPSLRAVSADHVRGSDVRSKIARFEATDAAASRPV